MVDRGRRQTNGRRGATDRGQWASKTEYLLVIAGNVVGLGNVWRFPYLCFNNGGGAFLVPYGLLALVCGLPLFLLESSLGQYTQEGFITCWRKICPIAQGIGFGHMVMQVYGISYIIVQVWALFYLVSAFQARLPWASCNNTWNTGDCIEIQNILAANQTENHNLTNISTSATEFWERMLGSSTGLEELGGLRWELVLCLLACWVFCYFSIWKGVKSSGKVVYFTATFPYVMLLCLLVRGLTLPGAADGIFYYLSPDLSRLASMEVWIEAGSQICFSYSLTSGNLNVLGSYSRYKNDCYKDCYWLCLLNSTTSFVAGFAVFSVLGFMAQQLGVTVDKVVDSGPGLAFIVYPLATSMMPLPQFWTVCFFLMLLLLAADTHFVMVECIITSLSDLFPRILWAAWRHEALALVVCVSSFLLQLLLVTQGGIFIFQLIDYYGTSRMCHYFMALVETVAVAWIFGADRFGDLIEDMSGHRPPLFFKICWIFIIPLLSLMSCILYLAQYKHLKINNWYVYPDWAFVVGWIMTLSSVVMVPLLAVGQLCATSGTLQQRLFILCQPSGTPNPQTEKRGEAEVAILPKFPSA